MKDAKELCQTLSACSHPCQMLCSLSQGASEAAQGRRDVPSESALGEGLEQSLCSQGTAVVLRWLHLKEMRLGCLIP